MSTGKKQIKIDLISWSSFVTVIFLVLQVSGIINWSWWQLMIPIFVAVAILAVLLITALVIYKQYSRILRELSETESSEEDDDENL